METSSGNHPPGSIRTKILLFSILVTLLPSIGMGWFWYDISHKSTTDKVEQQLAASADIIDREIGLWFKERNYDLRVFSNSFVIAENLALYRDTLAEGEKKRATTDVPLKKITTYLSIITSKYPSYTRLAVLNDQGRMITASSPLPPGREPDILLPEDWETQVERQQYFVGNVRRIGEQSQPLITVGIPLKEGEQVHSFFVMEAYFETVSSLFSVPVAVARTQENPHPDRPIVTLLTSDGATLFTTDNAAATANDTDRRMHHPLWPPTGGLQPYRNVAGVDMLGMAFALKNLGWHLVIEEPRQRVFSGLTMARQRIQLSTALLTLVIGGASLILARHLIVPLRLLTRGVLKVADGDLQVELPVRRNDELGMVSAMFNNMVRHIRESNTRLEKLATTDPLTGLANRKQIMTSLDKEMEAFCRHSTSFAVLMIDIDHFKRVNDTYGHQAGDNVLVGVANILTAILRTLDTAGRFGGEEFLVILETTDHDQAMHTAERIRQAVAKHSFPWQGELLKVTVSVGCGAILPQDETVDELIGRVDQALYRAKEGGRNRVWCATWEKTQESWQ